MKASFTILVSFLGLSLACGVAPKGDEPQLVSRRAFEPGPASGNEDGLVDAGEGEGEGEPEAPACDVVEGSVKIENSVEIEFYRGCKKIEGDFTVLVAISDLSALDDLEEVTGNVRIQSTKDAHLPIDHLRVIGGTLTVSSTGATEFNAPVLESVGSIQMTGNLEMASFLAPVLANVTGGNRGVGSIEVGGNPKLPSCQVIAVAEKLGLVNHETYFVSENDELATCE